MSVLQIVRESGLARASPWISRFLKQYHSSLSCSKIVFLIVFEAFWQYLCESDKAKWNKTWLTVFLWMEFVMWTVPYIWLTELLFPKPAIDQLLRGRGRLEPIPSCCKWFWCVISGGGKYQGGESDYAGQKRHRCLFWLLHLNMTQTMCSS